MEFKRRGFFLLQIVNKKGQPRFLIMDEEGEIKVIDELLFPVEELKEEEDASSELAVREQQDKRKA